MDNNQFTYELAATLEEMKLVLKDVKKIERPRTKYHGRINRNATQSIPTGLVTPTALVFTTVVEDTTGMFSLGLPGQITCNLAGWYGLGAVARFDANATGIRDLRIQVNGVNIIIMEVDAVAFAGEGTILSVHTEYPLIVNDIVEVKVRQNSGGALNVSTAGLAPALWWSRIT